MYIKKNIVFVVKLIASYLAIILRVVAPILAFFYYFGEQIGVYLIENIDVSYGLFIRPMTLSIIIISVLWIMSLDVLNSFNRIYWFDLKKICGWRLVYRHLIWALTFYSSIGFCVFISTIALPQFTLLSWFHVRDQLFMLLMSLLLIAPAYTVNKIRGSWK